MNNKSQKKVFILLTIVTFLIVIFSCLTKQFQNDTFYNIKIGQYILKNGIDMLDHWSWLENLSYTYPHWLFDVLVGLVYNLFSWNGLYILTYILYALIGISIYYTLTKLYNNKILSYFLMLLVIILLKNFATLRAQIVTYSLFVWFYYFLVKLITTNNKKYIIFMFLDSVLIANFHCAVWPFILVLFLPYFVEKIIFVLKHKVKILNKFNFYYNDINIKLLLIAFFVCLLGGIFTPLKFTPYTYLIKTMLGSSQSYIGEHQPIVLYGYKLLVIYLFIFIIIIKNKKIYLSDIFLILGLCFMMLSSTRHQSLFIILSVFLVNKYLSHEFINNFESKIYKFFTNIIGIAMVMIWVWYILLNINIEKLDEPYFSDEVYPINIVNYIKENLDYNNIRVYNSYNWGSYLMFNDIKVMFDSRADLYTKQFNKKYEYLEEFFDVDDNYDEIIKKYNITHVIVERDSRLNIYLSFNNNYNELYDDKVFILYEVLK